MKLINMSFNKTALHIAVENGDIEIIKLLLKYNEIDVNIPVVLRIIFLIKF